MKRRTLLSGAAAAGRQQGAAAHVPADLGLVSGLHHAGDLGQIR